MKWLNSLDELLYEVMSWLLFFPITLWRAVFRPIQIMALIESEAALPEDQQFTSVLSPPLFLALALLVSHTVATALGQTDAIIASHHGLADLVNDNTSALVFRVVIFASFPLFLAARLVQRSKIRLDRTTLRQPFYEQCYPAAVFALGFTGGVSLGLDHDQRVSVTGNWLAAISVINFWFVETRWFARVLDIHHLRAAGNVFIGLLEGALFLIAVGYLFTR